MEPGFVMSSVRPSASSLLRFSSILSPSIAKEQGSLPKSGQPAAEQLHSEIDDARPEIRELKRLASALGSGVAYHEAGMQMRSERRRPIGRPICDAANNARPKQFSSNVSQSKVFSCPI